MSFPILWLGNDCGTPAVDVWNLEPVCQTGPFAILQFAQEQFLTPEPVDGRTEALPSHDFRQAVTEVVGQSMFGITLLDVDERMIELGRG